MEKSSSLFDRVYADLSVRQQRSASGKINCIPFGFPRFEENLPGIEKRNYYIVTANSKVGKNKFFLQSNDCRF